MADMPGSGSFPEGEEDAATTSGSREAEGSAERDAGEPGPGAGSGSGEDEEAEGEDRGGPRPCGTGGGAGGQGSSEEPCGGEQGQDDVDMSSTHGSSSGRSSSISASASTSTSSKSEQQGRERRQEHREMLETVQEMKKRLPSEKRSRSKASTVEALNYALNCVKQVQANSEYYKLLMGNGQEERKEAMVCPLEELESITSEHTLKNTDTFVVVFSLSSSRVLFASEQASYILNCKRKALQAAKFVELLFHQDVNAFYSHTAQPHLPPWSTSSDSAAILFQCAQVKSFFCRIRGGKDRDGEMRYNPFRLTPYLLKVQGAEGEEELPCCLALAERIISGYEAPRIPMDKRIFTTTHSPGCVFLEVDERAVPLLGYLPQDLIGTSVLTCLHPEDRTLMLTMHRKILKFAGQPPFEHSPIRFRCQNGDYITMDTSWSSFINPWSRKVAFIIGRHNVRSGPLNEDVFAAQTKGAGPIVFEEVKELQAQIYKLFLQPVHNHGSSGYGSLGSNGSHEPYISVASSSDSNGNLWEDREMTLQQISADVNRVKSWGQQAYLDSRRKLTPFGKPPAGPAAALRSRNVDIPGRPAPSQEESRKPPHSPSYQQINCVDSIIRYLESCTVPALKRKSKSLSITTSSSSSVSEEDKAPEDLGGDAVHTEEVTALEDAPMGSEQADPAPPLTPRPPEEEVRVVGLTKEVLSAHTQREELEYVQRFRHRVLLSPFSSYLQQDHSSLAHSQHHGECIMKPASVQGGLTRWKAGKPKHKRPKPQGSSDSNASPAGNFRPPHRPPQAPDSSWPPSESSQPQPASAMPPLVLPFQAPYFTALGQVGGDTAAPASVTNSALNVWGQQGGPLFVLQQDQILQPVQNVQPMQNFHNMQSMQNLQSMQPMQNLQSVQPMQSLQSMQPMQSLQSMQPMQSLQSMQPMQSLQSMQPIQSLQSMQPMQSLQSMQPMQNLQSVQPMQNMQPLHTMQPYMPPVMAVILPNYPTYPSYPVFPQGLPPAVAPAPPLLPQPFTVPMFGPGPQPGTLVPSSPPAPPFLGCSNPPSSLGENPDPDTTQPPALFSSSRSSSPLQLNLLQEELPHSSTGQAESLQEPHSKGLPQDDAASDPGNHDDQSTSSKLLDLMLQTDARSGTRSNASASGSGGSGGSLGSGSGSGSGSNSTSTSHTGSSSSSSKYFGSNDSWDTSRKVRKSPEAQERAGFDQRVEDSLWTLIQQTPEPVMMTYQIHSRDQAVVLQEDREKLLLLQAQQPWFSQEQKEELAEVHPWITQRTLPQEIDTQGCVECCGGPSSTSLCPSPRPHTPDSSCLLDSPPEEPAPPAD
ncbi:period circadian protein homolog 3 isoform X2 [Conger conger]|uniref:period circadian protein homolog 3 isoform X2 n=1 Tax=Conger conger TaxID=82655 RepID=UPI002A5AD7FB|nr:period circadian protein homolog 3 isoform X2 [Conger conger]